jgi:hypothetical protein
MAFPKNIGKKYKFFNLRGGGSTFLYLGSSQIINDTPQKTRKKTTPKKTRKKTDPPLLMQFLMPSFDLKSYKK